MLAFHIQHQMSLYPSIAIQAQLLEENIFINLNNRRVLFFSLFQAMDWVLFYKINRLYKPSLLGSSFFIFHVF